MSAKKGGVQSHQLTAKDAERITCQADDCELNASSCIHQHWQTPHRLGVSFYYYCSTHFQERVARMEAAR